MTPVRDFPGSPVVKTLPSNAGKLGSTPEAETKIHLPWGESLHITMKTQHSQNKNKIRKKRRRRMTQIAQACVSIYRLIH